MHNIKDLLKAWGPTGQSRADPDIVVFTVAAGEGRGGVLIKQKSNKSLRQQETVR